MKQPNKKATHDSNLSRSLQPDDGCDPRYDARATRPSAGKVDRKAAQLCAQVRRSLDYIIPEALQDSDWDAVVLDVQPAPNTGHLLVLLQAVEKLDEAGYRQLEAAVLRKSGFIRTAVAGVIQRRKAPTLTFRIVPS